MNTDEQPLTITLSGSDRELEVIKEMVRILEAIGANRDRWRALAYLADRFHMPEERKRIAGLLRELEKV